jgi:sigma-54 dependent transcriptional regulator, acetoin dehydrogenase operon transcriptional activator AcoR
MPLPPTSFFDSHSARVEWARSRYFDEGLSPSGAIGDAVFESWSRCLRLQRRPGDRAVFEPVTTSRAQLALQKNRPLLHAWLDELPRLEAVLGNTSCAAMLTDATGVLVASCCSGRAHEDLMPVATRIGVNLSEEAVGTTAPGVVARTGKSISVLGAEHFFDSVRNMHCAAAPIRDIRGRVAGVLDVSSERIPFAFDATAVVSLYAGAIENRLLVAQSSDHLVVRFQVADDLLDSALVGLVGVDANGHIAWHNAVARSVLGLRVRGDEGQAPDVELALGVSLAQLASLPSIGASTMALPNGLLVWARAEMRSPDGRRNFVAASPTSARPSSQAEPGVNAAQLPAPAPDECLVAAESLRSSEITTLLSQPFDSNHLAGSTLREKYRELIERTLGEHGGNVSAAAKSLGVSRGLIYRRLRNLGHEGH